MKKPQKKKKETQVDWRFGLNKDSISIWINVLSFILSILFYFRMGYNLNKPVFVMDNTSKDSLLVSDTRLKIQVQQLKYANDSLQKKLEERKAAIGNAEKKASVIRRKLFVTIHSDWDSLPIPEREKYTTKVITNLKKQKQP
jgi:hypothetical protein